MRGLARNDHDRQRETEKDRERQGRMLTKLLADAQGANDGHRYLIQTGSDEDAEEWAHPGNAEPRMVLEVGKSDRQRRREQKKARDSMNVG